MYKTQNSKLYDLITFGFLEIGIWKLFVIWYLVLGTWYIKNIDPLELYSHVSF